MVANNQDKATQRMILAVALLAFCVGMGAWWIMEQNRLAVPPMLLLAEEELNYDPIRAKVEARVVQPELPRSMITVINPDLTLVLGSGESVRLAGIELPPAGSVLLAKAVRLANRLATRKEVVIEPEFPLQDRVYVYYSSVTMPSGNAVDFKLIQGSLNAALLREGLAVVHSDLGARYQESLLAYQEEAKLGALGLWAPSNLEVAEPQAAGVAFGPQLPADDSADEV